MKRLVLALILAFSVSPALAQQRQQLFNLPKGPIATAIENKASGGGDPAQDLLNALEVKLLPDLKYALNVATSSGDDLTAPCWSAWIKLIEDRQKAKCRCAGQCVART